MLAPQGELTSPGQPPLLLYGFKGILSCDLFLLCFSLPTAEFPYCSLGCVPDPMEGEAGRSRELTLGQMASATVSASPLSAFPTPASKGHFPSGGLGPSQLSFFLDSVRQSGCLRSRDSSVRRRPVSAPSKELGGGEGRGRGERREGRRGDEEGGGRRVEVRRWGLREVGGERRVQRDGQGGRKQAKSRGQR